MKAPVRWACTWVQLAVWAVAIGAARAINKPPAGERPTQPAARATSPARAPLSGHHFPPASALTWVKDVRYLEADCGCVHVLDHVARTRRCIPCNWHEFDVDEWNRRLSL